MQGRINGRGKVLTLSLATMLALGPLTPMIPRAYADSGIEVIGEDAAAQSTEAAQPTEAAQGGIEVANDSAAGQGDNQQESQGDCVCTVSYIDENGDEQVAENCARHYRCLEDDAELRGGWYVVDTGGADYRSLTVTGDSKLILDDGDFTVLRNGIHIAPGASLKVYCKAGCEGKATLKIKMPELETYVGEDRYDLFDNEGTLEINDCNITCEGEQKAWQGIECRAGATTTLNRCAMSGFDKGVTVDGRLNVYDTKITDNGCGIDYRGSDGQGHANPDCELHVKGDTLISGNNKEGEIERGDIFMCADKIIYVDGPLANSARIGVRRHSCDGPLTKGYAEYGDAADPSHFFFSSDWDYLFSFDESGEVVLGRTAVYLDENGNECRHDTRDMKYLPDGVQKDKVTLNSGWYLLNGTDADFSQRLEINGDVTLIMGDLSHIHSNAGIHVGEHSSLKVYSLKGKMGTIISRIDYEPFNKKLTDCGNAQIGGNSWETSGKIVLCDVLAEVVGPGKATAIGAGEGGDYPGFDVTIAGDSIVTASIYDGMYHTNKYHVAIGSHAKNPAVANLSLSDNLKVCSMTAGPNERFVMQVSRESLDELAEYFGDFEMEDIASFDGRASFCQSHEHVRIMPNERPYDKFIHTPLDFDHDRPVIVDQTPHDSGPIPSDDTDKGAEEPSATETDKPVENADDGKPQDDSAEQRDFDADKSRKHQNDAANLRVSYVEHGWEDGKLTDNQVDNAEAKAIPADCELTEGLYSFTGEQEINDRIVVTGDAGLVLNDNCKLLANGGIYVAEGATLSIYGTSHGGGTLVANSQDGAGIGACQGHKGGNIVIHGGTVEATGANAFAGIGSGDNDGADVGSVTIYGGNVKAEGGHESAGIGGGKGSECEIAIYGGKVSAKGNGNSPAIGCGKGGSIKIFGGETEATGREDGAALEAAKISITGGTTDAKAYKTAIKRFGGMEVSGQKTVLRASSEKSVSIENRRDIEGDGVHITKGATLESFSGDKSQGADARYWVDDEDMYVAGPSKEEAEPLPTNYRDNDVSATPTFNYICITPCDHRDATYETQGTDEHKMSCPHCLKTDCGKHRFNEKYTCEICGYDLPRPVFATHGLPIDGALGLEFVVDLPEEIDFSKSYMEFVVAGSNGEKETIPFENAREIDKGRVAFTCHLSPIQLADDITANYYVGDGRVYQDHYSMMRYVDDFQHYEVDEKLHTAEVMDYVKAIQDYGHYMQVYLSQANGWTIGVDHAEVPKRKEYGPFEAKCAAGMMGFNVGGIKSEHSEEVTDLTYSIAMNSMTAQSLFVETDVEIGGVKYDSRTLPKDCWHREGKGWRIDLPAVHEFELNNGKEIMVTSVDGKEIAHLQNVCPLAYVGPHLDNPDGTAGYSEAMATYYYYFEAARDARDVLGYRYSGGQPRF